MEKRIDVEVWRIGFDDTFEFVAKSSYAQEWMTRELGLKGTGSNVRKLVVRGLGPLLETSLRMLEDGLTVAPPVLMDA